MACHVSVASLFTYYKHKCLSFPRAARWEANSDWQMGRGHPVNSQAGQGDIKTSFTGQLIIDRSSHLWPSCRIPFTISSGGNLSRCTFRVSLSNILLFFLSYKQVCPFNVRLSWQHWQRSVMSDVHECDCRPWCRGHNAVLPYDAHCVQLMQNTVVADRHQTSSAHENRNYSVLSFKLLWKAIIFQLFFHLNKTKPPQKSINSLACQKLLWTY